jgi:hypothetical protein
VPISLRLTGGRSGTVASALPLANTAAAYRIGKRASVNPQALVAAALVNLDRVQRQMELGGSLFAILLAELILLALELAHLLPRRLQQRIAPGRIVMRVVRHD